MSPYGWNNTADKQYIRNLGTGDGIELVYLDHSPASTLYIPLAVVPDTSTVTSTVHISSAVVSHTIPTTSIALLCAEHPSACKGVPNTRNPADGVRRTARPGNLRQSE